MVERKEAVANARFWRSALRKAFRERHLSDGHRCWAWHCARQYALWCDLL